MPVLARYLMKSIIGHTLLVTLVLLMLNSLYLFFTQQDEIGTGTYTTQHALLYVALNLPQGAFETLPIASLIGALLALGNLARSMELTVIRAAGVSTGRLAWWVGAAGIVLMMMTAVLGEFIAPQMEHYGRQMKTFEKFHDYSMAGNRGAWAKDGDTIIAVQQQNAGNIYGGVYVFKFDGRHRLLSLGKAGSASIDAQNRWQLSDYRETKIAEESVVATRRPKAEIATRLSPEFLGLAVIDPGSLPGRGLYAYIQHLKQNGLDARQYETSLWARIARTAAVAIIVILAVPFAIGPMRSTGTGTRTVVGIMMGVVFFLLAKMMESGGAVFDLPPVAVAWTPTVILALVTSIAIARVK